MRAERRSSAGTPPDVLARHAAEIDRLTMHVASLKVYINQCLPVWTVVVVCAGLHPTVSVVCYEL